MDLTNSSRCYNLNDWKKEGIKHVKVSHYLTRQKPPKKYILVHCTHGHNRAGYMIVHCLMRTMPISVTQAINIFSEARPLGIYKPDYIDALYRFYHEMKPDGVVCTSTPVWKKTSDLDLNGDAVPDEDDDDGDSTAPPDETNGTQTTLTNDDILGDKIPSDQEHEMRHFVYQTMKLPGGRGQQQFPGSHPVSLNRENLLLCNMNMES